MLLLLIFSLYNGNCIKHVAFMDFIKENRASATLYMNGMQEKGIQIFKRHHSSVMGGIEMKYKKLMELLFRIL